MHPTADLVNVYLSVEKFLFEGLVDESLTLLVDKDSFAERLTEIEATKKTILWQLPSGVSGSKCDLTLYVGGTFFEDAGNMGLLRLLSKAKSLLELSGSIPVYQYMNDEPQDLINQLVLMPGIVMLPLVIEPNNYRTRLLAVKLKYAQILA